MTNAQKKWKPLSTLHLILMLAIAGWWAVYFANHTPAGAAFSAKSAKSDTSHGRSINLDIPVDAADAALRVALPDLALGALTLLLFAVGTRGYVTRLETWLWARTSGQAVSLGGRGLEDEVLSANSSRRIVS